MFAVSLDCDTETDSTTSSIFQRVLKKNPNRVVL